MSSVTTEANIISREFIWAMSDEYGNWGWRPTNMPDFDPSSGGLGIAHDTLEHFDTDTGALTDEFQAFGAIIHVRALQGYWSGKYITDPAVHLSDDIARFIYDQEDLKLALPDPGPIPELEDEYAEELVRRSILRAFRDYKKEYGEHPDPKWFRRAAGWIRIGVVRAEERYAVCPAPESLFRAMQKEVEERFHDWWDDEQYEGCRLTVIADLETCKVQLHVDELEYPEDPFELELQDD